MNYKSNIQPRSGRLLVSEPFYHEEIFNKSVILLCNHDEKGSFGLVLNKPIEHTLGEAIPLLRPLNIPLHYGGPVETNTLHYIHVRGDLLPDAEPIGNGIYWGGNFEQLLDLLDTNLLDINEIRFFIGYSGWDFEQLDNEIDQDAWAVTYCKAEYIFNDSLVPAKTQLWRKVLKDMGGKYRLFSNFPDNPQLN